MAYVYIGKENGKHKVKDTDDDVIDILSDEELLLGLSISGGIDGLLFDTRGNIIDEFGRTIVARIDKLNRAKREKCDEFYTRYDDIDKELSQYPPEIWRNKVIYCPCDVEQVGHRVPRSNFIKWFLDNADELGFKALICTSLGKFSDRNLTVFEREYENYDDELNGVCHKILDIKHNLLDIRYNSRAVGEYSFTVLNAAICGADSGDFRSKFCTELLLLSDIVVTNPPFSIFRQFYRWLRDNNKDFIILGNKNFICVKDSTPDIQSGVLNIGFRDCGGAVWYAVHDEYHLKPGATKVIDGVPHAMSSSCWFTSFDYANETRWFKGFTMQELEASGVVFEKYLNYDAINIDRSCNIPTDYKGVIGVPVTFMQWYNKRQCEIVGTLCGELLDDFGEIRRTYKRLLIRWK